MGLISSIREQQNRKRLKEWLQLMKPYVWIPLSGDGQWVHWEFVPTIEEICEVKYDGLPVLMTKEECAAANGGNLPDYWGEMPYAWRSEAQKRAFYANYPALFSGRQTQNEEIVRPQA